MTFTETKVTDFWGDPGTVGVETAHNSLTEQSSPVVEVLAFDTPYALEPLQFTPDQARTFAAAIVAAANHLDPEGVRPFLVIDKDGDVWHRTGEDTYEWANGSMRMTLAEMTADYGPISEARA